jgi:D-glycero-alpha-D-manno-heptose-7-phosphate kinase
MIIAKAPLRISIGGGGTDLPSYYERFESTFISAAIDKYIYISLHPIFIEDLIIKYSELERVRNVDDIRHPIVREALKQTGVTSATEISSFADIPSGTGLGSSGSFTVALLKALYTYRSIAHSPLSLAEDACRIEIEKLGSPIGKQDQYISSIGGLTRFHIDKQGNVSAHALEMKPHHLVDLQEHLLLFFTGFSRSANEILKAQDDAVRGQTGANKAETEKLSQEMLENLHFVNELGIKIGSALEAGEIDEFGRQMNIHWAHKKKRSKNMSSGPIEQYYDLAMKNGAIGGKLIGAGGGGFLMFLADDKRRLRKAMREAGLHDVPFGFDQLGAQVVLRD